MPICCKLLGRERLAQVLAESLDRDGVVAGPDDVVVEVDQVGLDLLDGEIDELAVEGCGVRMVAVPVVAIRRPRRR